MTELFGGDIRFKNEAGLFGNEFACCGDIEGLASEYRDDLNHSDSPARRPRMRIAVASTGPALDDDVSPEFDDSKYLLIVDFDTLKYEAMISPVVVDDGPAAGRPLARQLLQEDVSKILAGRVNFDALKSFLNNLQGHGIQVIDGMSGSVRSAVRRFKQICLADTIIIPCEDIAGQEYAT